MLSKIFLYAHGGSGNHGCEAIVRATARILQGNELYLISSKPEEDRYYGFPPLSGFCEGLRRAEAAQGLHPHGKAPVSGGL